MGGLRLNEDEGILKMFGRGRVDSDREDQLGIRQVVGPARAWHGAESASD